MKQLNKMLYKRLIIGDYHGHFDTFKEIYQNECPYSVIMLGDYFDNFSNDANAIKSDFDKLINLRKEHLNNIKNGDFILLLGNHDYHYLQYGLEQYSGYNKGYDLWAHGKLKELWDNNELQLIEYDYTSKTIYSHAGITNTWLKENRMDGIDLQFLKENKYINLFKLRFTYLGGGDYYGESVYSSPIWIRPNSLLSDMYIDNDNNTWTQIVGHTNNSYPVCYYPKSDRIGNKRCIDYNIINSKEDKPILWVMDCMPKYYIREMITLEGSVVSREIIKNENYHSYKSKKY